MINLYFTPNGGQKTLVYGGAGADSCDPTEGGWFYSSTSTGLIVCDKTCDTLARLIHHCRGASLGSRHHSAFASLTNTTSIRSVTESTVMTTTFAIRSRSGELSRLESTAGEVYVELGC